MIIGDKNNEKAHHNFLANEYEMCQRIMELISILNCV